MDLNEQQKYLFWQGASHLPHVSTVQAVKLMSATNRVRARRACHALTFRSVEVPSPQPKCAADGASKKVC
jgi:hypothetical protein